MDIEEDPEINLSIPLKPIYEEFICPICFEKLRESRMTPCGHNFCKECIEECLNRKHNCPCCNAPAIINSLVVNKQLDRFITIVEREKDKSSKEYFDRLISGNQNNNSRNTDSRPEVSASLSPIEQLFQKHMKKSLIVYQDYYKTLENGLLEKKKVLTEKYGRKVTRYKEKNGYNDESPKINEYKQRCQDDLKKLDEVFESSTSYLLESYDQYLGGITPSRQFLPVNINIQLAEKGVDIKGIRIERTTTPLDIKKIVTEYMENHGDPIAEYSNSNIFVLYPSFASSTEKPKSKDGVILADENVPILQYSPENNALLVLKGKILFKSDEPKRCFRKTYQKGDRVDYFACAECKLNWICKNCSVDCHKGHTLKVFFLDNAPTWGCCYCFKSKKCQLTE